MALAAEPRKKLRVGIYKLSWIVFKNQYAYDLQLIHRFPYSIIKKECLSKFHGHIMNISSRTAGRAGATTGHLLGPPVLTNQNFCRTNLKALSNNVCKSLFRIFRMFTWGQSILL